MSAPSTENLTLFWRELSQKIRTGSSTPDALAELSASPDLAALKPVMEKIAASVGAGSELSDALAEFPGLFPDMVRNIARAGESGDALDRAAGYIASDLDSGVLRPGEGETKEAAEVTDPARRKDDHVAFWRILGQMIGMGVPLLEALVSTAAGTGNKRLIEAAEWMVRTVQGGGSLAGAMRQWPGEFAEMEYRAVRAGESSGDLEDRLFSLASALRRMDALPLKSPEAEITEPEEETGAQAAKSVDEKSPEVRKYVNQLLAKSLEEKATDLYIEGDDAHRRVRLRADGALRDAPPPEGLGRWLVRRLKAMAGMDVDNEAQPQSGRIAVNLAGEKVELEADTLPCVGGERLAVHFLRREGPAPGLDELGLSAERVETLKNWSQRSHGIALCAGPAGSGKITTLHALVRAAATKDRTILCLGDLGRAARLESVSYVRANPDRGFGYDRALQAALRQGCDVIVLGESSAGEFEGSSARIAAEGRLVLRFGSAHSAADGLMRLAMAEPDPRLLALELVGVGCQRLVRRLCDCKKPVAVEEWSVVERDFVGEFPLDRAWAPVGCEACGRTGYRGRRIVCELLEPDEAVRGAVARGANAGEIEELARANGMQTLREDALAKVAEGVTSVPEAIRALL